MKYLVPLAAAIALVGCNNDSDSGSGSGSGSGSTIYDLPANFTPKIVASATDYSTSDVILLGDTDLDSDVIVEELLATTDITDIAVTTFGSDFYRIGRYGFDNITKYEIEGDSFSLDSQFSVNGGEVDANPYAITFISETQAYVARYGSPFVWEINPSATTEEEFIVDSAIDLSAYINESGNGTCTNWWDGSLAEDQTTANASDIAYANGQVFVLLQRLDNCYSPSESSYLIALDPTNNSIIDANGVEENSFIELGVNNAAEIHIADDNTLVIYGIGDVYNVDSEFEFTSAIVTVDTSDFSVSQLLDNGSNLEPASFDYILDIAVSGSHVYYITANYDHTEYRNTDLNMGLVTTDGWFGVGSTPASLAELGDIRDIAVVGDKIYFAIYDANAAAEVTEPGFIAWDTATQSFGDFIPTLFPLTGMAVFE